MSNISIDESGSQSEQIDRLFSGGKWDQARHLISDYLQIEPESHWLLTRLSTTYYEEKQYEKALEYLKRALTLAPNCPLVLWDYASTLDMIGRQNEAIDIYKRLIKRGIDRIAYGDCGEGKRWARSLINDSRYRLGLLYGDIGNYISATKYLKAHIENRSRSTPSIYGLREVKKKLAKLIEGKNPRNESVEATKP